MGKVNAIFNLDAGRIKNVKVYTADVYGGLVRADYYLSDEAPSLIVMKKRISEMVEAGIIVYANHMASSPQSLKWLLIGMRSLLH